MVVWMWQDPQKVHWEEREESLSVKGGGIGQMDPVEKSDWLDEVDEEEVVQVGLKQQQSG